MAGARLPPRSIIKGCPFLLGAELLLDSSFSPFVLFLSSPTFLTSVPITPFSSFEMFRPAFSFAKRLGQSLSRRTRPIVLAAGGGVALLHTGRAGDALGGLAAFLGWWNSDRSRS